ncbi:MAG TPA: hypothetical protein VFU23_00635 [Gemmatimonadales bacterium]|nr:hypothetical protein [Gemmatimonadales bacterium]
MPSSRARMGVVIAILVLAVLLLLAGARVRSVTSAAAMERRLLAALGATGDSLYRVRVGSSRLSILGRRYLATGIEIVPDSAAFRRRREAGAPVRTRYALRAGSFLVTGLDVWGLFTHRLAAERAVADSLVMEVYLDRTTPMPLDSVRRLPHEFFRTIHQPFRLDTFRIEHGEIRYSERAVDGARPGTIRFANSRIGVYNLNNDLRRPDVPVVIDVHTLLAGMAPTTALFQYDFRAPALNLVYEGSVGDLDAERLNTMTVDLEGMRLTAGHLDSAWFKFRVKDGVADGEMVMKYRRLHAEFVDKVTRDRGFSEWIKSLMANAFAIKGHNRSDGDHTLRTASIRRFPRTADLPFAKYVWHTLRQGIFLTVTGEPPTPSRAP